MKKLYILFFALVIGSYTYAQNSNYAKAKSNKENFERVVKAPVDIIVHKAGKGTIIDEGFEGASFPPANWTQVINNTSETWKMYDFDPYEGLQFASCAYDANIVQQDEYLVTPSMDFSLTTAPTLNFWFNGNKYWSVNPYDNCDLFIYASTDGGTSWSSALWSEEVDTTWGLFEWAEVTVDLSTYTGQSSVVIAFNYYGLDGAQFNVDAVLIEGTVGIEEVKIPVTFKLFPNPAKDYFNIKMNSQIEYIKIYNLIGKVILEKKVENNEIKLNTSDFEPGLYFLKIKTENGIVTRKVTVKK